MSEPNEVIRQGIPADAAAVAVLLIDLGYECSVDRVRSRLARLEPSSADVVLLAVKDGRTCGLATVHLVPLFHVDDLLARITSFVVTQGDRRCGVGSRLLDACGTWARDHGAGSLELTSGDRRVDAHQFYESRGFEREGNRFTKQTGA